ncbi:lysozyme inhibitor LprI family protein [Chitinophaga sp. CB10]|uniref:lysozyme inhibitor LprI family protein n=1 Tax=Chitinophaga sp. CB10 TaxID=1891659 RepID=UPI0025BA64FE|nr:lysozyme inhibitor LprI family protein [Chitinophaga sp. CB10]
MRHLLAILAIFGSITAYAQQHKDPVEIIEERYQRCLAQSSNMFNCATLYYQAIDSALSATIQHLYGHLSAASVNKLQQDQIAWEERKDAYFKKIDERVEKLHKSTMQGLDDDMISTDNKAAFLKNRLVELYREYELG